MCNTVQVAISHTVFLVLAVENHKTVVRVRFKGDYGM